MTATEYQRQAYKTLANSTAENISYLSFGLVAEVGEVADKIAKAVRRGDISIIDDKIISSLDKEGVLRLAADIADELGDVLWFVAMLAQQLGYSLEEVMKLNLVKLADRQARGVIIGDGDKR